MEPYAIIETGGKQYRVQSGSKLNVERLEAEAGSTVEIGPVLAISDGTALKVGAPTLDSSIMCSCAWRESAQENT